MNRKPLTLALYQNNPRYYNTGDYFLKAAPLLGVKAHLYVDNDALSKIDKYDVMIHFFTGGPQLNAKKHMYYERDSMNEILFQDKPQEDVYYTQWPKPQWNTHSWSWSSDHVIMHAANPYVHRWVDSHKEYPPCDAVFCGRLYGDRSSFLNDLKHSLAVEKIHFEFYGDGKSPSEYVKILSSAPIILAPAQFGEINRRIFEAMAIGCCVTSKRWGIKHVGEDQKDFWIYGQKGDIKGATEVIKMLHNNPDLVKGTAKRSRKTILDNHTYFHRLRDMLRKGGELV